MERMSKRELEILDFINRRWKKDADWCNGNCYYFSLILRHRFPYLENFYCPIKGHFVVGFDGMFFDWTGRALLDEAPIPVSQIETEDPLLYARLLRDCMC